MKSLVLASIIASVIVCLVFSAFAFARARSKGRYYALSTLFFGEALYAAVYAVELTRSDLAGVLDCLGFEYLGIQLIILSLFFMVRDFKGKEPASPRLLIAAAVIPAVTVILGFTVESHELLYIAPYVRRVEGLTVVYFDKGPWYWVNVLVVYGLYCYSVVELIRIARQGNAGRRTQALVLLAGCFMTIIESVVYLADLTPAGIDLSAVAFAMGSVFFYSGFFRYRLFDMHPIARDAVFEHMHDAALVIDEDGAIVDFNRTARTLFPQLQDDEPGVTFSALCDGYPALRGALEKDGSVASLHMPDGQERRFEAQRSRISGKGGREAGSLLLLYDITDREILQEKLREQASLDDLTRVANRRKFYELAEVELERARRYGHPIGFAVMDMNGFKEINDRYGHKAGDDALRLAAELCVDALRSCDIVGRIGGDEFAFVFPECDEAAAAVAAKKIRQTVGAATFSNHSAIVRLSAAVGSVGSTGPAHPELEELLATADRRMYADKPRPKAAARA